MKDYSKFKVVLFSLKEPTSELSSYCFNKLGFKDISILDSNGNKTDHSEGFQMGKKGMPKSNPYEMEIKGEKEDLTWLIK